MEVHTASIRMGSLPSIYARLRSVILSPYRRSRGGRTVCTSYNGVAGRWVALARSTAARRVRRHFRPAPWMLR